MNCRIPLAVYATVATLLFAWLATSIERGEWSKWNDSLLEAQHARSSADLDLLALVITWFGYGTGVSLVVAGLVWLFLARRHPLAALTLLMVVGGVMILEAVLKPFFAIPRTNLFPSIAPAGGYSFPSGHALRGIGIYGYLAVLSAARAYQRNQLAWWAVATVLIAFGVAICWSRVYLGVHTPTDVIAGGLAASAWVAICLVIADIIRVRQRKHAL